MFIKTFISYPVLLLASIVGKKSFERLGDFAGLSGKTVCRLIKSAQESHEWLDRLVLKKFKNKKILYLSIDDTKIRKIYSECMEGTDEHYDSEFAKKITAYKLLTAMLSDGNFSIPLNSMLLFSKELVPDIGLKKSEWIKNIILKIQKMFPNAKIYVVLDGSFTTKDFLQWCTDNKIKTEVRMKSNCVVTVNGEKKKVKEIDFLRT
jgi:hypothetical protein